MFTVQLPTGDNIVAVNKYVISNQDHIRYSTLLKIRKRKHIPLLEVRCLLLSPALRSNTGMANRQGEFDLRFSKSLPPFRTLAWIGLAWLVRTSWD
jgi:riboflavin synthase